MKKFVVFLTRDITESAHVVVEAESAAEATEKAFEQKFDVVYETDDGIGKTYVSSCEEL